MAVKLCSQCGWAERCRQDLCLACDELVDRCAFAIIQGIWTSPEVSPISNERVWLEARALAKAKYKSLPKQKKKSR